MIRHLINVSRRRDRKTIHALCSRRPLSTAADCSLPCPPPPTAMIYDRLSDSVKEKLRKLGNPDSRFLKYNSPHPTVDSHAEALSTPLTRVTTLPNGLRIATESTLASKTATVGVFIDDGSRFESDETNGIAHFLQHMIFKGTAKRTSREMVEEIDNMGGHLEVHNSREQTTYYVKVLDKDVPKALHILSDILQNSRFDEKDIDRERDVILGEITKVDGQSGEVIFDHLHATAFQHSPLGRSMLGTAENIATIGKEHLQNYISTHYTTPRMVVAASGAVKHEDVVEQVKTLFTKLSTDPTLTAQLVAKEPAIFTGSEIRMRDDNIPLAQFAVAFEGASSTDSDSIALMVMQSMLGSWNKNCFDGKHTGSELVQRVAINKIAESMTAFNTDYKDTGLFGVYAVAKPECLDDLAYAIMYELTKLCYRVSEVDVIRARNQLKSSMLLHIDGTFPVAEEIGQQMLTYGRRIPYAELFARIDSVDPSTIKRVANRFIFDKDVAIVGAGPIQGLPDYNWFRRRTYWVRY